MSDSQSALKVLCIGDIMLDVVAILESEIHFASDTRALITTHGGGAAANVATWLAHTGIQTFLIARVGDDAAGRTVLAELDRYGVRHSNTVIKDHSTGVVIVLVDKSGERTMFPDWGANSGLSPADLPPLEDISAIYLSGYPLINPASRQGVLDIIEIAQSKQLPIIFDPASVGVLAEVGIATVLTWLPMMDVLVLNEEEAHFLSGASNPVQAAATLLEHTPTVVIKRGANGALGQSRTTSLIQVPSKETKVVDTTGAGDSFAAGFLPFWISGAGMEAAMVAGTATAAQCVAIVGARPLVVNH